MGKTHNERFKAIPDVFLMPIQDGKILLSRRFQTGWDDGNYNLVAGHADGGETMREAMVREAKEEVGIVLDSDKMEFVHVTHRFYGDGERIGFFFVVNEWQGTLENREPEKCDDISWFSLNDLPLNMNEHIRSVIESYKRGEMYSELGFENR